MASYQCKNCGTTILQNYVEKCDGCGSRNVVLVSGLVLDQEAPRKACKSIYIKPNVK